jgi:lambda repressor-like predicted transcriptional regulator
MQDIRFISGDGESLVLETQEGEKFRLAVDSSIRAAVKTSPKNEAEHVLTPREIQDAVRAGSTVEELATKSGESTDYLYKFANPVLEELEHMVAAALSVRVEIEPDRFNEVRHREFGELMLERLQNGGASSTNWRASRTTPFTWEITASFETMGGTGEAVWTFDPRAVSLSPENETAIGLSSQSGFGDAPIPRLKAIVHPTVSPASSETKTSEVEPPTELLDAFRKRREAAAAFAETEPLEVEDAFPDEVDEPFEALEVEDLEADSEPTIDASKKGRAPMPSWDEIVFGARSDEQPSAD